MTAPATLERQGFLMRDLAQATRLPGGRTRSWAGTAAGRRVIGVDGEGSDIDSRHSYTLLCAADDWGWRDHIAHDGSRREGDTDHQPNYGLPTKRCLDFLLSLPSSPTDLVVMFSGVYDGTKIVADLPARALQDLSTHDRVDWEGYRIEFLARKWFRVTDLAAGKVRFRDLDGRLRWKPRRHVNVFDAFGYWQMSFVGALRKAGVGVLPDELRARLDDIEAMKGRRSQFADIDPARVLAYCFDEVEALAHLMRDVIVNTERSGIVATSFHGSSAVSAKLMDELRIADYLGDPGIPADVVMGAFYGARFETRLHGLVGDVRNSDINSAYPYQLCRLPCLAHARARWVDRYVPGALGVYLAGSRTSGDWAPFPIRIDKAAAQRYGVPYTAPAGGQLSRRLNELVGRQVMYAHGGRRWVWSPEVETARRYLGDDAVPVYGGWLLEPGCEHRPFEVIAELYDLRRELKRSGDGRQMVLKITLNAIYGKTAQTVGKPKFLSHIWAGLITSGCRAQILDAIYQSGTVVAVATDGLLSTEPIEGLAVSGQLGDWEGGTYRNLTIYNNGVYTFDQLDEDRQLWSPGIKSRGFSERDITGSMLRRAWDDKQWEAYPCRGGECDSSACTEQHRAFMPLRQAFGRLEADGTRRGGRTNPLDLMGQWVPNTHPTSFIPRKRRFPVQYVAVGIDRPDMFPTEAYTLDDDVMGLPYEPHLTYEQRRELDDFIGPDYGEVDDDAPEIWE